jgi:hypothetical protein
MTCTAMDIYQAFLDESSRQIMAREYDLVAASMVYPQTVETSDCNLTFDTPAQMVEAAASFRTFLSTLGATDYHRICDMADISEDGTEISGEHTTYIIRGGQFAVEPYRNRMWLRLDGGVWRGAGIAAAVQNRKCMILSPAQLRAARERDV